VTPVLEAREVTRSFSGIVALDQVSLRVDEGERVGLIGPNGAGKTTLLLAILGQVPYTGTIRFCRAAEHGQGAPRIGYVPQRFPLDPDVPITVLDFFALSARQRPVFLGASRRTREIARESLGRAGVAHLLQSPLGRLSGGELQRVLFALALRDAPDILLFDEPVSGVDVAGEELFCDFLSKVHRDSRFSLLLVSHDLSVVTRHADQVICLNRRLVCSGATTEVLTPENLAAMYGTDAHLFRHSQADGHGHLHDDGRR
jgi:zinc transport system ATP-binding protein